MSLPSLPELIFRPEGPKLEFKRQPWDLGTVEGKAEFIKDVCALVNSPGNETGYIVLGVTDADRTLVGIDRGLLGEERLQQIIADYIDPPFDLSFIVRSLHKHFVGLISIPTSAQKPHMIDKDIGRLHKGTCFIRRGSITALARSSDYRIMIEEVIGAISPEEIVSEQQWSREEIELLDHLALSILWAFIETEKTELLLSEIGDHCHTELEGKNNRGRVLAGKLKMFYSKLGKDKLIEKNKRTGKWRFNDRYRSCVAGVLREKGFL